MKWLVLSPCVELLWPESVAIGPERYLPLLVLSTRLIEVVSSSSSAVTTTASVVVGALLMLLCLFAVMLLNGGVENLVCRGCVINGVALFAITVKTLFFKHEH